MRIILQRVLRASCTIDGELLSKIGKGYLLFLGIEESDTSEIALRMVEKIKKLRIFEDENGKTNLNAEAVNGSVLLIPQFTLYADCKSNRPGFSKAANPGMANAMFNYMLEKCKLSFPNAVYGGKFGADMKIDLVNDGPFTLILDSKELFKSEPK